MTADNSLFFMPLLVGSIFFVMGFIMYKFPPKEINYLYGYRTSNSMKSKERWDFAQVYSAKLMIYCGVFLMIFSGFGLVFHLPISRGVFVSSIAIFVSLGVLIYKTERAITQKFGKED